ncbi:MAG: DUF4926 domain-containing protein [Gemmatimonadaceae bacterium]
MMSFKELDRVVLLVDMPEHGLRVGDAGTVVHVHSTVALEVEFLRMSGHSQAVVTVDIKGLRPAADTDVVAARSAEA